MSSPAGAALTALARFALPAEPEDDAPASFPLRLSKAPTQEEFIRGRMTKNPYDSLTIRAETMRDVKNFVCASLDMHGLCDDDYGMELLVAGRIVSLDLTVREAYDGVCAPDVWRRRARRERPGRSTRDEATPGGVSKCPGPLTGPGRPTRRRRSSPPSRSMTRMTPTNERDPAWRCFETPTSCAPRATRGAAGVAPLLSDGGARLGPGEDERRCVRFASRDDAPVGDEPCFLRVLSGVARVEKNRRALLALNAIPVLLA